jgi:hypothetical protein
MIDQNITDKLTNAVCDWATAAARELQGQRDLMEAFHACLNGADVQIVAKLRHGVIELQGIREDKYIVLYRHNVEPMRLQITSDRFESVPDSLDDVSERR